MSAEQDSRVAIDSMFGQRVRVVADLESPPLSASRYARLNGPARKTPDCTHCNDSGSFASTCKTVGCSSAQDRRVYVAVSSSSKASPASL